MTTSLTVLDSGGSPAKRNPGRSQRVETKRRFHSGRPITLVCERIWRDWFVGGVPERSLSIMYELTREAVEEVLREQARVMMAATRSAMVRTACLLIGLSAMDAWEAAVSDDATVIARAFRKRRGSRRRRGLEDGGSEAVDHARAQWRTSEGGGLVWQV